MSEIERSYGTNEVNRERSIIRVRAEYPSHPPVTTFLCSQDTAVERMINSLFRRSASSRIDKRARLHIVPFELCGDVRDLGSGDNFVFAWNRRHKSVLQNAEDTILDQSGPDAGTCI